MRYAIILLFAVLSVSGFSQAPNLSLTLRFNPTLIRYEVYAMPDASQSVFNWGPSQITIVVPATMADQAFTIISAAGGAWQDNSQVYSPAISPGLDFHGVGSLGAVTTLFQGVEKLIFHFTLPGNTCVAGLRLYINDVDPNSSQAGMNGGDFTNTIFAIVSGVPEGYEAYTNNYNNGGTSCSALPLDLTLFSVNATLQSIDLLWHSINEANFDHFEVERSVNSLNFIKITDVAPSEMRSSAYQYVDNSVIPGRRYFYRLKMVDEDGFYIYSPIESTIIEKDLLNINSVSPNPTKGKTVLLVNSPSESELTIKLLDFTSNVLETIPFFPVTGLNEVMIDLSKYPVGVYTLSITSNDEKISEKIIKIH